MIEDSYAALIKQIQGIAFDTEVMPLFDILQHYEDWGIEKTLAAVENIRERIKNQQENQAQKDEEKFQKDLLEIGQGSIGGRKSLLVRFLTSISKDEYQIDEFRVRYVIVINDDPEGKVLLKNFSAQYSTESARDKEYERIKQCLAQYTNIRFL